MRICAEIREELSPGHGASASRRTQCPGAKARRPAPGTGAMTSPAGAAQGRTIRGAIYVSCSGRVGRTLVGRALGCKSCGTPWAMCPWWGFCRRRNRAPAAVWLHRYCSGVREAAGARLKTHGVYRAVRQDTATTFEPAKTSWRPAGQPLRSAGLGVPLRQAAAHPVNVAKAFVGSHLRGLVRLPAFRPVAREDQALLRSSVSRALKSSCSGLKATSFRLFSP